MLTLNESENRRDPRVTLWRIFEVVFSGMVLLLLFTKGPLVDRLWQEYPTVVWLAVWVVAMLSYHQDIRLGDPVGFAVPSQILAVVSLMALLVSAFTHRLWLNLLIAPPLIWLHIQLTRRWWARPGAWW
jgi:hypothetical protein